MQIDLHGLTIECESPDETIRERWAASFASRPRADDSLTPDIVFELRRVHRVPDAPSVAPAFTQGDLLSVYQLPTPNSQLPPDHPTIIHFPRFGHLRIDLPHHTVHGEFIEAALATYGVFEDVIAMGLTAHLRRRGFFMLHAFAAAWGERAVLLVGDIGSGKTTTGISLLRAGWKLLSNDSPFIGEKGQGAGGKVQAFAYPGLLSAYPNTLERFP